jgi:hypothetical protein
LPQTASNSAQRHFGQGVATWAGTDFVKTWYAAGLATPTRRPLLCRLPGAELTESFVQAVARLFQHFAKGFSCFWFRHQPQTICHERRKVGKSVQIPLRLPLQPGLNRRFCVEHCACRRHRSGQLQFALPFLPSASQKSNQPIQVFVYVHSNIRARRRQENPLYLRKPVPAESGIPVLRSIF